MTDDNIDALRKAYAPPSSLLESRERRTGWLRVRLDDLRSNIAVLLLGDEPPVGQLEALRTELASVKDELRALGVDP